MLENFIRSLRGFMPRMRLIIPDSLNRRGALGISVFLHVFIGMALASFLIGKVVVEQQAETPGVVFDLQTNPDVDLQRLQQKASSFEATVNQRNRPQQESKAGSGRPSLKVNKQAVLLSSLASLSELKDSFNFVMQSVSADSAKGFSPLYGNAPDTEAISAGFGKGDGYGDGNGIRVSVGGGHGSCPKPGIFK